MNPLAYAVEIMCFVGGVATGYAFARGADWIHYFVSFVL